LLSYPQYKISGMEQDIYYYEVHHETVNLFR